MNILICTSEYFPYGSGIANVAYNVVEQLKNKGINCFVCSTTGPDIKLGSHTLIQNVGIFGLLFYWYRVSRHLKFDEYDVVWLHNPLFLKFDSFDNCLVTIHTTFYGFGIKKVGKTPFFLLYYWLSSIIEKYCLKKLNPLTQFTVVNPTICTELEQIGIPKENITYITNGVDIIQFHPVDNKKTLRKKFGIPEKDILLLSIGRLTSQKQPHLMVEVFSAIEKQCNNITLFIAGMGELLNSTKDFSDKMGVQKIHFFGYVDQEDLPDLYACADYYISTSKYEGSPLTLFEAMASGLPCIVSDIPNLMIVRYVDCGIVVNFNEIQKAANEILHYIKSEHNDHSKNARKYAIENLNWNKISEQYLKRLLEISRCNKKIIKI